ncbi:MAG: UDP-N-acetylmuramoyl-L-alanine--D-glutamate ligase, partial [Planctomycetota bacterium]
MNKEFFAGKKVLVMGLGRFGGGVDAARFVCSAGAEVKVTDLASADCLQHSIEQLKEHPQIEYHLGSHTERDFEQADIVIVNPAVPPDNKFVKLAHQCNKSVTSQMNIFFELCPA